MCVNSSPPAQVRSNREQARRQSREKCALSSCTRGLSYNEYPRPATTSETFMGMGRISSQVVLPAPRGPEQQERTGGEEQISVYTLPACLR